MGYETKLVVVMYREDDIRDVIEREDTPQIEDDCLYYPYKKDENGDFVKVPGMKETWCQKIGEIDLSKLGRTHVDSVRPIIDDDNHLFFYYADDGNTRIEKDRYDDPLKPYDIVQVLNALKEDIADAEQNGSGYIYRRLVWAAAFLEGIVREQANKPQFERFAVLQFGH